MTNRRARPDDSVFGALALVYGGGGGLMVWDSRARGPSTAAPECDGKVMRPGSTCVTTYTYGTVDLDSRSGGYDEAKQALLAGRPADIPIMAAGWVGIVMATALIILMVSFRTGQWLPPAIGAFIGLSALGLLLLLFVGGGVAALLHQF